MTNASFSSRCPRRPTHYHETQAESGHEEPLHDELQLKQGKAPGPGRGNAREKQFNTINSGCDVYTHLKEKPTLFWYTTRYTVGEFQELLVQLVPGICAPRNVRGEFSEEENAVRRHRSTKLSVFNRLLLVLMCRHLSNHQTVGWGGGGSFFASYAERGSLTCC